MVSYAYIMCDLRVYHMRWVQNAKTTCVVLELFSHIRWHSSMAFWLWLQMLVWNGWVTGCLTWSTGTTDRYCTYEGHWHVDAQCMHIWFCSVQRSFQPCLEVSVLAFFKSHFWYHVVGLSWRLDKIVQKRQSWGEGLRRLHNMHRRTS